MPGLLLFLFIAVTIVTRLINIDTEVMNLSIALSGILCFGYYIVCGNKRLKVFGICICLFLSILMAISIVYNGNARVVNILWIWAYMGAALILYEFGLNYRLASLLFYLSSLFFVYQAITGKAAVDEILNVGSQNNISTLCIFMMIAYYIAELRNASKSYLSIIPAIIVLFISIWTASRAALLTMSLFALFVIFYNLFKSKTSFSIKLVIIVVVAALPFVYFNYLQDFGGDMISKLDRYGVESERTIIWSEYFKGVSNSVFNFLFGVNGSDPQFTHLSDHEGNTHNAFLMLHAKFGLFGFLLIIIYLAKSFVKAYKTRQFVFMALLAVVGTRSIFDWTAFPGLLDVIFYFFILFYKDDMIYKQFVN